MSPREGEEGMATCHQGMVRRTCHVSPRDGEEGMARAPVGEVHRGVVGLEREDLAARPAVPLTMRVQAEAQPLAPSGCAAGGRAGTGGVAWACFEEDEDTHVELATAVEQGGLHVPATCHHER